MKDKANGDEKKEGRCIRKTRNQFETNSIFLERTLFLITKLSNFSDARICTNYYHIEPKIQEIV